MEMSLSTFTFLGDKIVSLVFVLKKFLVKDFFQCFAWSLLLLKLVTGVTGVLTGDSVSFLTRHKGLVWSPIASHAKVEDLDEAFNEGEGREGDVRELTLKGENKELPGDKVDEQASDSIPLSASS